MHDTTETPSRTLNEVPSFMGLTTWDICVVGYLFILAHAILSEFGFELLSFGVAAFAAYALSIIRMNNRRKIIRDSVKHFFHLRKLYDPKN